MKYFFNLLLIFFTSTQIFVAQENDPYKLIEEIKQQFDSIQDYEVDAEITIDVSFLKAPVTSAKIYYKKPDMVKLQSDGFALLPKEGLSFTPSKIFNYDFTALYAGQELTDSTNLTKIKLIPNADSLNIVLSTLWIDETNKVITKIETTTKKMGTFKVGLFYGKEIKNGLPDSVVLSFNSPEKETKEGDKSTRKSWRNIRKNISGKVSLVYSNYKINTGIPDSFFEEEVTE